MAEKSLEAGRDRLAAGEPAIQAAEGKADLAQQIWARYVTAPGLIASPAMLGAAGRVMRLTRDWVPPLVQRAQQSRQTDWPELAYARPVFWPDEANSPAAAASPMLKAPGPVVRSSPLLIPPRPEPPPAADVLAAAQSRGASPPAAPALLSRQIDRRTRVGPPLPAAPETRAHPELAGGAAPATAQHSAQTIPATLQLPDAPATQAVQATVTAGALMRSADEGRAPVRHGRVGAPRPAGEDMLPLRRAPAALPALATQGDLAVRDALPPASDLPADLPLPPGASVATDAWARRSPQPNDDAAWTAATPPLPAAAASPGPGAAQRFQEPLVPPSWRGDLPMDLPLVRPAEAADVPATERSHLIPWSPWPSRRPEQVQGLPWTAQPALLRAAAPGDLPLVMVAPAEREVPVPGEHREGQNAAASPPSAAGAVPPSSPATQTTAPQADTGPGVDLDELVDKVLRKLMRGLAVESERKGLQRWT